LKEIGAHLSLTETKPLSDPSTVPSLITRDNKFHKNHNKFLIKFLLKTLKREHIYIELKNQLNELKKTGLQIINLSSHEHIHMLPEMLDIFVRLAKEYDIPTIRYPHKDTVLQKFDINRHYRYLVLSYFDKGIESILKNSGTRHADHFLGFLYSGRLREDTLIDMLKSLNDGTTELVCHPGFLGPEILDRYRFHVNCEEELSALTSQRVKNLIRDEGIKLTTYSEFLLRP
ncbi:MAG: ChbG/HpnK family deacetylase, partial [Candidatus Omnitrophica bacterium]|nr:ChbG/HpnK family deacetylase [Candidatus Omnitrophota bacterium]